MRKIWIVTMTAVAVSALALVGCGKKEETKPAEAAPAAPAAAPAPAGAPAGMPPAGMPPAGMAAGSAAADGASHTVVPGQGVSGVTKAEGGVTVADVYAKKSSLAGKDIKVRGKVVKFQSGIMGTNWLHLQDGTGKEGTNDLTVTSDSVAAVGDVVTVSGKLTADKDFGYGYRYSVIIEKGKVEKK